MSATKICPQCGREESMEVRFCPVDGTALRIQGAEASDLVGQIVADRYHVLRKLGEGGMGQVYLVEHVKMQRKSALKVMNPGMVKDADAISRFNREAANASRINHPNVASVYDFGETPDGLIFLAMEFVDGPPLTKVIEQQGALQPARAAEIIRQAADALAVAHDMGIVHRDLKPDNIMVAKTRDGGDLVKVVDFGIAKAQDSAAQKVTQTGMVVGTPEYMSPEQLSGDKLDGRSDIYSLGLVAFNMLTGALPFVGDSQQETMIMRLTDKPKHLGDLKPEVSWPEDVQAVMDRVLARTKDERYQSAPEFGRDLVRAIDRMPATQMMAAGTMVIGASGAVAGAGARAGAGAPTAAMPATRVASVAEKAGASAPGHGAAAPAKNMMPMMVGGALVSLAVIGFVLKGQLGKAKDPADPGAPPASVAGSTQAPVDPPKSDPAAASGGGDTKAAPPAGAAGGGAAAFDATKDLDRIYAVHEDDTKADWMIAEVTKNFPRYTTGDQKAKANLIRYWAYRYKGDNERACVSIQQGLKTVEDAAGLGLTLERQRKSLQDLGVTCS
jgi:predicted Ser/Thr protein kinase